MNKVTQHVFPFIKRYLHRSKSPPCNMHSNKNQVLSFAVEPKRKRLIRQG